MASGSPSMTHSYPVLQDYKWPLGSGSPLPLTPIVYHIYPQNAIGRMHKIGIFIFLIFVQLFS